MTPSSKSATGALVVSPGAPAPVRNSARVPSRPPALVPVRGRVCHVIDGLGPGGAERLIAAYLPRIADRGFKVEVVVLNDKAGNPMAVPLAAAGIPVRRLEVTKLRNPHQIRAFLRGIRSAAPDLIHAHLEFATVLGTLAGRRLHRPVVSTLHTLDAPGLGSRRDLRRWLMYRVMSRWTDRVICLTQTNARDARDSGLGRARIVVLPNGVEVDQFDAPPQRGRAEIRASFGIPPDAPLMVTVCVLRLEKGVDRLLRALPDVLAPMPEAHLLIVGDGPERVALENLVWAEGLAGRVHFAGFRSDVADLMRAADLFVLATLFDAQPTVIIEAMAARLPVVASHVGGVPDMVEDGVTGTLVRPDNPRALAHAIVGLLGNPARARAFGAAGRRRTEADFSMDLQIDKLCGLYDRLIAGSRGRP